MRSWHQTLLGVVDLALGIFGIIGGVALYLGASNVSIIEGGLEALGVAIGAVIIAAVGLIAAAVGLGLTAVGVLILYGGKVGRVTSIVVGVVGIVTALYGAGWIMGAWAAAHLLSGVVG